MKVEIYKGFDEDGVTLLGLDIGSRDNILFELKKVFSNVKSGLYAADEWRISIEIRNFEQLETIIRLVKKVIGRNVLFIIR